MPLPLQLLRPQPKPNQGFTFAEVCVSIVIAVLFGAAAFATNNRLLTALKDQKGETAATMMLQERMEKFRSIGYTNVGSKDYVYNNILKHDYATNSEAALGNLTEYITISGALPAGSYVIPSPNNDYNQWYRNAAHSDGQEVNHNDNLSTNYDLLKVDIVISWTGANGRTHTRELASIFGKGNISQ